MPRLSDLKVKLFTDGADKAQIVEMAKQPWIAGFTTNPSLLKKAGVNDYEAFGRDLVAAVPDRHISFEVFSDDIPEMVAQGRVIASWGKNVHVKLPVTNDTRRAAVRRGPHAVARRHQDQRDGDLHARAGGRARSMRSPAARRLAFRCLPGGSPISASTTGRSCRTPSRARGKTPNVEIIWASTREVFNVVEADEMGCHIITAPADVLKKLPAIGTMSRRRTFARRGAGVSRRCGGGRPDARPKAIPAQGCTPSD